MRRSSENAAPFRRGSKQVTVREQNPTGFRSVGHEGRNLKRRKKAALVAPVSAKGFEFVLRADIDPPALGAELRRLRENCQVTLSDLAERMDWKVQNVSRLERGGDKREPTLSSVNLYVRMLGFELVLVSRPKKARAKRDPGGAGTGTPAGASGDDE
jgi:DNA-binding XRE family transcriptional regulator